MGNNFLISARAPPKRRIRSGRQKTLFYRTHDKTGGEKEKALLSQSLAEENEIGTGNQRTFRRNLEKDSKHRLLGGPFLY
ncbi:hypothetical protein NDU88_002245 [Pleurodeles waltl]|uniref:Uncharacterized protein n=1 Tax=Pleurodeles waltl TaxID=8319 RepID=A0AAV7NMJ2_PLEWA|nr:hypothetical protein NDU88_002245 [Pleurodeles waltl]